MGCGALSGTDQILRPELQFRKLKQLSKNQQTQIWTCQNNNKQKFSIKVFKQIFIYQHNQYMLKNFQQEINRLYQLSDKNKIENNLIQQRNIHLLPYIKAWKDQNCNLSLIMQYIQQNSLGDQVKGKLPGLFNQIIVAKFTQQILITLKYLRSHGSIFCNIKTTNMFLDKSRQNILLTDYYNLQQYFKLSETNIYKIPYYSAPQNVLFNQYFQQTDIWRIGCFIIQLLTCIKPWYKQTTNNQKIIQNLKNHIKPPIPQKISNSCKLFLQKCFQTDHNRRISIDELLMHDFITSNVIKQARAPNKGNQRASYQRENTSIQQIASYNLQLQLVDESTARPSYRKQIISSSRNKLLSKQLSKQLQSQKAYTSQLTPIQNTNASLLISRKKSNSNFDRSRQYETSKVIISENDKNIDKSIMYDMKKSKHFRAKRFKTQAIESKLNDMSQTSPYSKQKKNKQILSLLNKKKAIDLSNSYDSPTITNKLANSRKVSKTANYRLSKSKKKIPTNQITLNNQVLVFNDNSSSKYWPGPQNPTPFNYLQTAQKLNMVMKQIQKQGGKKYYKKPLKLLKQKLRDKTTLRTQTSITLEDSRAFLEKSQQQIQEIDFQDSMNYIPSQDYQNQNQTEFSKISFQTTHQNQVIETMTSKAYRQRFQTQQKVLKNQRQKQKMQWQKQLVEGRQFIKNEINKRYHFSRNGLHVRQE